jgi:hypothetical protein
MKRPGPMTPYSSVAYEVNWGRPTNEVCEPAPASSAAGKAARIRTSEQPSEGHRKVRVEVVGCQRQGVRRQLDYCGDGGCRIAVPVAKSHGGAVLGDALHYCPADARPAREQHPLARQPGGHVATSFHTVSRLKVRSKPPPFQEAIFRGQTRNGVRANSNVLSA